MAQLSEVYPFVLPELPGCPIPMVDRAIVDSVREICRRTDILRSYQLVSPIGGQKSYQIAPPTGMEVIDIKSVSTTGGNVYQIPLYTEASSLIPIDDSIDGETIVYYRVFPQDTLNLYPTPKSGVAFNDIRVQYSYQPVITSTTIPDDFVNRWAMCVAARVKYMLMMQPGKEWSAPDYATVNKHEWWRLMGDITVESNNQYGNLVSEAKFTLDM